MALNSIMYSKLNEYKSVLMPAYLNYATIGVFYILSVLAICQNEYRLA